MQKENVVIYHDKDAPAKNKPPLPARVIAEGVCLIESTNEGGWHLELLSKRADSQHRAPLATLYIVPTSTDEVDWNDQKYKVD